MPRIEFYVLSSSTTAERLRAACQLAGKAWRHGLPVFLRGSDAAQCSELDELLWRARQESFIPHDLHQDDPQSPIVIGLDEVPEATQGVLINLGSTLSPHIEHFSRVIEIVNQEPDLLTACRENFRSYRQRGYDPKRVEL
ncbi:DNA polymerase III subunit chi [Pseudomonas daroniae]|uniref:DNA polymerase III subunit chi n=1 Tax=Phytopseudomonas daroniae TaxID=2487519 RepID=A0A4Q9QKH8_9GAMM|nr:MULTISPECIES: DNA polymerase III subunit chi [Pseudomonas]TBU77569.1 DNA polymerase III subunit chi [Pseudomonas daroniae]TBU78247.1 DNA polymerase III subunit chi [Pseudomonas daroniae]TBU85720.1 DNA polymerase III subunit chi [Pseudomonas sp. FRB 228]TBU94883.1 DNA polymerase III subunit chi [Pseudomonas daroniae]